jgi:FlgN protein
MTISAISRSERHPTCRYLKSELRRPRPVITFEVMNGMTALSHTLLRERRLLELLTYRLETQHHLLASGRARFISLAAREIEEVLDELGHTELERAVQVSGIAERLGLPDEPSLEQIVEVAPAPWQEILAEHRAALRTAADEVDRLAAENRAMLEAAYLASAALVANAEGDV